VETLSSYLINYCINISFIFYNKRNRFNCNKISIMLFHMKWAIIITYKILQRKRNNCWTLNNSDINNQLSQFTNNNNNSIFLNPQILKIKTNNTTLEVISKWTTAIYNNINIRMLSNKIFSLIVVVVVIIIPQFQTSLFKVI
jgi:hypothetical protein